MINHDQAATYGDKPHFYEHDIIKTVKTIIEKAISLGASDIHFEPGEYHCRQEFRTLVF